MLPGTSPTDTAAESRAYRRVTRRLIPFLFCCYGAAYLDRVNIGFAKLQMLSALRFSETVYGLGAGIFFIGYFLFEIPSNIILHKVGARRWIARVMLTWGLISAAMVFVRTPTVFYILRFLLGVAEAGFFPGIILYLTYWYPAPPRARVIALFITPIPLARGLGGPPPGSRGARGPAHRRGRNREGGNQPPLGRDARAPLASRPSRDCRGRGLAADRPLWREQRRCPPRHESGDGRGDHFALAVLVSAHGNSRGRRRRDRNCPRQLVRQPRGLSQSLGNRLDHRSHALDRSWRLRTRRSLSHRQPAGVDDTRADRQPLSLGRHAKLARHPRQGGIERPQPDPIEQRRRKQVRVHPANTATPQPAALDQRQYFVMLGDPRRFQGGEIGQDLGPRRHLAQGDLAQHKRGDQDRAIFEPLGQLGI